MLSSCSLMAILPRLTSNEIRQVQGYVSQKDFRLDIVAQVPPEIIPSIFRHLSIDAIFRAMTVSRRWKALLSSPGTISLILHHWYTNDIEFPVPSASESTAIIAEQVDAFQTGTPFDMEELQWDITMYNRFDCLRLCSERIAYCGGRLALVNQLASGVKVHLNNLQNGEKLIFTPPNREKVSRIVLSNTLLVYSTFNGKVLIYALENEGSYSIQLPSANICGLAAGQNSVAILHGDPGSRLLPSSKARAITMWSKESHKSHQFHAQVSAPSPGRPKEECTDCCVIVDPSGDSVVYFEHLITSGIALVRFSRYSLGGNKLSEGRSSDFCFNERILFHPYPSDKFGGYVLMGSTVAMKKEVCRISYNLNDDSLRATYTSLPHTINKTDMAEIIYLYWKNVLYILTHEGLQTSQVSPVIASDFGCVPFNDQRPVPSMNISKRFLPPRVLIRPGEFRIPSWNMCGDEDFLIIVHLNKIQVYSFKKTLRLPHSLPDWRNQRKEDFDMRLNYIRRCSSVRDY